MLPDVITSQGYIINGRFIKNIYCDHYRKNNFCIRASIQGSNSAVLISELDKDVADEMMKRVAYAVANGQPLINFCNEMSDACRKEQ